MSNSNVMRKPEELADDLSRRDAEWAKWERAAVQAFADYLQPILLANYPGGGWFCISMEQFRWGSDSGKALTSAFGQDLRRLFACLANVYSQAGWQLSGQYGGYRLIDFNFKPLSESSRLMERLGGIQAVASVKRCDEPMLPTPPSHVRPNLRGQDSLVSGVVLLSEPAAAGSAEPFIYENLC